MHEHEFEVSIGDVLRVGDYTVTVVDVEGEEVGFQIDDFETWDALAVGLGQEAVRPPR